MFCLQILFTILNCTKKVKNHQHFLVFGPNFVKMLGNSCLKAAFRVDPHILSQFRTGLPVSSLHTTACLDKEKAGRYQATVNRTLPLTYEMAFKPPEIGHKKGYNSFNTAQLV